jgi:hypothetical protein
MIAEEEARLTRQSELEEATRGEALLARKAVRCRPYIFEREYYPDK